MTSTFRAVRGRFALTRRMFMPIFWCWLVASPAPAPAATKTWLAQAFGGDRRWSVGTNWGGTAPVNGDNLFFNQRSTGTFQDDCTNNISSLQIGSILFNGTGNAVPDIWGNTITISGGVSEGVSFWGASLGTPLTLSASQTFESVLDGHLDLTNLNIGTHTLTLSTRLPTSRITVSGRITGSGQILVDGPGTVSLRAPLTNTFTGRLRVQNNSSLSLAAKSGATGIPSVVGDLIVGNGTTKGSVTVSADNQIEGDVLINAGGSVTLLASDSWPTLTLFDAGVLIANTEFLSLGGPVTTGGTSNSTIRGPISLGSASRNFVVSNGVELRLAGPISGVNFSLTRPGLIKGGGGTLVLQSNNTFTGNVSINAGRVIATESLSLGSPTTELLGLVTGATSVSQGGELMLSSVAITNELLTLATTTGGLVSTGGCRWAGTIALQTDVPITVSNGSFIVTGPIIGPGGLTKLGVSSLILAGTNTFSGLTRCEASLIIVETPAGGLAIPGNLEIGTDVGDSQATVRINLPEQISDTAEVILHLNGSLQVEASETIGALRGGGNGQDIQLNGGTLTVGGNGTDDTYSGSVVGTFGLTKIGSGVQTLSGNNTFTGPTRVLAGTLRVNGTQSASPVQVIGAALEGSGTVGAVTCNGRIAPGEIGIPARLTCGNLTYQAGGSLAVDLGGQTPGTQSDQLAVRGSVQLANATLLPTLRAGYLPSSGDSIVILENDGTDAVAGTFLGLPQNAMITVAPGRRFRIRYDGGDGNDVSLTFTNETAILTGVSLSIGNGNGRLDPNECALLNASVSNQTAQALTNVRLEFRPRSAGISITEPVIAFRTLPANGATAIPTATGISVASSVPCGSIVTVDAILSEAGSLISSAPLSFLIGPGGPLGCVDGGGACTYCPDVVIGGTLRTGDTVQTGALDARGTESSCAAESACPGVVTSGARLVDAFSFQNGPKSICLTVELENLCDDAGSELFATVYSKSFNPADLCANYRGDIGSAVTGGKSGKFALRARADELLVVTVSELKPRQNCADYRLTVSGGDCRPRLAIQPLANANIIRLSWPNSGLGWHPESAPDMISWSNLVVTPTNEDGRIFFDSRATDSGRFFRLRQP